MNEFSSFQESKTPTEHPVLYIAPLGDPDSRPPSQAELRKMISDCSDIRPSEASDGEEKEL